MAWVILFEIRENVFDILKRQTKSRVRARGGMTESFELQSGVRQGCPLSPTLFNVAVDWILRNAMAGVTGAQSVPCLR